MKGKYLQKIGGIFLAALMLSATALVSTSTVEAQWRRRVVIVPRYRVYRPFGFRNRWNDPFRYNRFGYDPYSPFNNYYSHYVFRNTDSAIGQGYKDGFKTGEDDGKKAKSFDPQRSHYYQEAGFGNFAEIYRSGFSRGYQEGFRAGAYERSGRAG